MRVPSQVQVQRTVFTCGRPTVMPSNSLVFAAAAPAAPATSAATQMTATTAAMVFIAVPATLPLTRIIVGAVIPSSASEGRLQRAEAHGKATRSCYAGAYQEQHRSLPLKQARCRCAKSARD